MQIPLEREVSAPIPQGQKQAARSLQQPSRDKPLPPVLAGAGSTHPPQALCMVSAQRVYVGTSQSVHRLGGPDELKESSVSVSSLTNVGPEEILSQ